MPSSFTVTMPSVASLRGLLTLTQTEPAVILFGVNAAVALGTTWGLNLSPAETGTILVCTTAVLSALTALLARPAAIPVVKGALVTVLTALEAFHLHLSQPIIAGSAATLSIILGLLFRQGLTPVTVTPPPVYTHQPPVG